MFSPWTSVIDIESAKRLPSKDCVAAIEDFFESILNHHVIVLPSGRSALAALLKFYHVTRGDKIFIPQWSSHCVISTVGAFGGVSYTLDYFQKVAVCVHKFGQLHNLSFSGLTIEDSVDSLFESGRTLFHNSSEAEIISLPKVMGTNTGGLIVTKNKKIKNFVLELRNKTEKELTEKQYFKKIAFNQGKKNSYWGFDELENFAVTREEVNEIYFKIPLYLENLRIINERYEQVQEKLLDVRSIFTNGRIGTSLFIPGIIEERLMNQHFNTDLNYNKNQFRKGAVLPLHLSISDDEFIRQLNILKKRKDSTL